MFQHIESFKPRETGYRLEIDYNGNYIPVMENNFIVYYREKKDAEQHQFILKDQDKESRIVEHIF